MKKIEKYIYIVVLLIFAAIIVSGITYMLVKPKDNDVQQENDKNEQITLSESELAKYLDYIPNNYVEIEKSVYRNPVSISNIDNKVLLGKVLNDKFDECQSNNSCQTQNLENLNPNYIGDMDAIAKSEIDEAMLERYNKTLSNLVEGLNEYVATYNSCYLYNKNYFITIDCAGLVFDEHLSYIDSYETNENDELIIYEYAAIARDIKNGMYNIINYITSKEITLNDSLDNVTKYFENNKSEFTKYKHIFKKNNTGYYWISTETLEN